MKPSILIIYTGGTIGMTESPENGALSPVNFDQLSRIITITKIRVQYHIDIFRSANRFIEHCPRTMEKNFQDY